MIWLSKVKHHNSQQIIINKDNEILGSNKINNQIK